MDWLVFYIVLLNCIVLFVYTFILIKIFDWITNELCNNSIQGRWRWVRITFISQIPILVLNCISLLTIMDKLFSIILYLIILLELHVSQITLNTNIKLQMCLWIFIFCIYFFFIKFPMLGMFGLHEGICWNYSIGLKNHFFLCHMKKNSINTYKLINMAHKVDRKNQ